MDEKFDSNKLAVQENEMKLEEFTVKQIISLLAKKVGLKHNRFFKKLIREVNASVNPNLNLLKQVLLDSAFMEFRKDQFKKWFDLHLTLFSDILSGFYSDNESSKLANIANFFEIILHLSLFFTVYWKDYDQLMRDHEYDNSESNPEFEGHTSISFAFEYRPFGASKDSYKELFHDVNVENYGLIINPFCKKFEVVYSGDERFIEKAANEIDYSFHLNPISVLQNLQSKDKEVVERAFYYLKNREIFQKIVEIYLKMSEFQSLGENIAFKEKIDAILAELSHHPHKRKRKIIERLIACL